MPAREPGIFPGPTVWGPTNIPSHRKKVFDRQLLLFKKGVTIENAYMRLLMKFCCVNIAHFVMYVLWKGTSVASRNIYFHFRMTSNQTLFKSYSKRKTHRACWVCIKFLMVVNNLVLFSGIVFFHLHSILDKRLGQILVILSFAFLHLGLFRFSMNDIPRFILSDTFLTHDPKISEICRVSYFQLYLLPWGCGLHYQVMYHTWFLLNLSRLIKL